jgi:hypothetical protein
MPLPIYNDVTPAKDDGRSSQLRPEFVIRLPEDRSARRALAEGHGTVVNQAAPAPRSGAAINTRSFLATLLAYMLLTVTAASPDTPLSPSMGRSPGQQTPGKRAHQPLAGNIVLQRILPAAELQLLLSFTTEAVTNRTGEYVVVSKCRPQDCSDHHALVVEKPGELWVGLYEAEQGAVSTRWYGTREHTSLPPSIQETLTRVHTPE